MRITSAHSPGDIMELRQLFREYEEFLDVDLCFQNFEEELDNLPGKYASPDGTLLLAIHADRPVGCVALRKLEPGICEMKRLFVRPEARRRGYGLLLAQEIVRQATALGYSTMRLDTLRRLDGAVRLYKQIGFLETEPYYDNPLADVAYFEFVLPVA